MKTRSVKRGLLVTIILCALFLILIFIPAFPFSFGATNASFTVTVTIGNLMPNITWVQANIEVTPNAGTTQTFFISFNATDGDGYANLNNNSAKVIIIFANEQSRQSTFCRVNDTSGNTTRYNCSVTIQYFDLGGNWQVNASIYDLSNDFANNTDETVLLYDLTAVDINQSAMSFSASLGEKMVASTENPLGVNNLGNVNITTVNITAYHLNKTGSSERIEANWFTVNATDGFTLATMQNATRVTIPGAFVARDYPAFAENESLYMFVNISNAGLTAGDFQSLYNWVVDVS